MSDGRSVRNTTRLQSENKRAGSNTSRGHDAVRPLRHGSAALHGIHTRLGCRFGGQTTQRCKVYECGAVLETLRADTLWEREIGHEHVGMGMCCCTLVTKLTANCVSQFVVAQVVVLAQRQMGHVCSHMVVAWLPVRSGEVAYGAGVVVGQLRVDVKPPLNSCCVFFFVSLIVFSSGSRKSRSVIRIDV